MVQGSKFVKRKVVVEAIQFSGHNFDECKKFLEGRYDNRRNYPNVETLHGFAECKPGDWIIKGPYGDYWPCKPDIFEASVQALERMLNLAKEGELYSMSGVGLLRGGDIMRMRAVYRTDIYALLGAIKVESDYLSATIDHEALEDL